MHRDGITCYSISSVGADNMHTNIPVRYVPIMIKSGSWTQVGVWISLSLQNPYLVFAALNKSSCHYGPQGMPLTERPTDDSAAENVRFSPCQVPPWRKQSLCAHSAAQGSSRQREKHTILTPWLCLVHFKWGWQSRQPPKSLSSFGFYSTINGGDIFTAQCKQELKIQLTV